MECVDRIYSRQHYKRMSPCTAVRLLKRLHCLFCRLHLEQRARFLSTQKVPQKLSNLHEKSVHQPLNFLVVPSSCSILLSSLLKRSHCRGAFLRRSSQPGHWHIRFLATNPPAATTAAVDEKSGNHTDHELFLLSLI